MPEPFQPINILLSTRFFAGAPSHWVVLILGAIFIWVTVSLHRKDPDSVPSRCTRALLIFGCLMAATNTAGSRFFSGQTERLDGLIPLHLCDLIAFVAAFALLFRTPLLCELTYFLGLGGTLQGLITPNVQLDFPHPTFFAFFHLHYAVVAAALLLPLGLGWRPRAPLGRTILKMMFTIVAYLALIHLVNLGLGTNFAFTVEKPENPSLFDVLGPHPWYMASVLVLSFAMLLFLSAPFALLARIGPERRAHRS